ncbi:MAG: hypothetical protein R2708_27575 [Vicinamibacterales bacterium]
MTLGNRLGRLGLLGGYAVVRHEQANREQQIYYRAAGNSEQLSEFSATTTSTPPSRQARIGAVGNVSLQFTPSQRVTWENFYTHSGRTKRGRSRASTPTPTIRSGISACSGCRNGCSPPA